MFTERCVKTLGMVVRQAHLCCFTRLNYNKSGNLFCYGVSTVQKWISQIITFMLFSYSLFNFSMLVYLAIISPTGIETVDLIWLILFSSGRFWGFSSQLTTHLHHETISYFLNCLAYFQKKAESDESVGISTIKGKKLPFDLLNFIVLYYSGIVLVYPMGAVLMFALRPKSPQFLYALLVPKGEIVLKYFAICIVFEFFIVIASLYALMVDGMTLFTIYILATGSYLSDLKKSIRIKETSIFQGISTYKLLILLGKIHKDSMGFLTPIFFSVFGIQWTLGTVGTIRFFHVVTPADYFILCILFFCGGTVLLSIIHYSGNIPLRARCFIENISRACTRLRVSKQNKFLTKTTRSLKVFGIRTDPVRVLKHNAIYLYFGSMINCIVTFLVAFPTMGKVKLVNLN